MNSVLRRTILLGLSAALTMPAVIAAPARAGTLDRPVYLEGHGDLCTCYDDGKMELSYHFHEDDPAYDENNEQLIGEFGANELYTRVPSSTVATIPAGYAFLGGSVGSSVWILSDTQDTGVPFLGFSTKHLNTEDPGATWSSITYSLIGADGPGHVSMWMSDAFGSPLVYWATADDAYTVNGDNTYVMPTLAHSHANWGFTSEGLYEVQMQISGTRNGQALSSDVETFTFLVGNSTVPEPGTFAMLLAGGAAGALALRRRKYARKS